MSRKKTQDAGKQPQVPDGLKSFFDTWQNLVARQGIASGNLISQGGYTDAKITQNYANLENAYRGSWLAGAIVDLPAEDMTREGIDIGGIKPDEAAQMQKALIRLGCWKSKTDCLKWARLYGGAVSVIQIEGADLAKPLDVTRIGKGQFRGLVVYDRYQIEPYGTKVIKDGPEIGMPMFYRVVEGAVANVIIHHSRVIRQIGIELPWRLMQAEQFWGMSVLERVYDRMCLFDSATHSAGNLLNFSFLRTMKVDGFRDIMAAGDEIKNAFNTAMQYLSLYQSMSGITLIDAKDDMSYNSFSFSGLSDTMMQFGQQLSGACGIPLTRLFGQSPAGMNATGESDMRNYYDTIKSAQESRMLQPVQRILSCLYPSLFGKPAPAEMDFSFVPLWQMSAAEKVTNANTTATAVIAATDAGIIDQATALKELKTSSEATGIFASITDEMIAEAEEEPPAPGEPEPVADPAVPQPVQKQDPEEDLEPAA